LVAVVGVTVVVLCASLLEQAAPAPIMSRPLPPIGLGRAGGARFIGRQLCGPSPPERGEISNLPTL
jgi:hypothetical protein